MPWSAEVHAHRTREARRQARLEARGCPARPQSADASLLSLVAVAGERCPPPRFDRCALHTVLKLGPPLQVLWRPAWRGSERGTSCGRTAWSAGRWPGPGSTGTCPGGSPRPPCGRAPQRSSAPRCAPALGLSCVAYDPLSSCTPFEYWVLAPKLHIRATSSEPCPCQR